jgi:hypothetical protein
MSNKTLNLVNQFGEESLNTVVGGDFDGVPIASNTILANLTGSTANPSANTIQAVANKLPAKAGITAISAEAAATAITIALSTSNTYSDAAVNSAVNAALVTVVADINAAITQMNAILAAMKVSS